MTIRAWAARSESGSASVLVAVLVGVLAMVALLGAAGAGVLVAHRRASAAADLAALAAAEALGPGRAGTRACPAAGRVSAANGAELTSCQVLGDDVLVRVGVERSIMGWSLTVPARARAGPVSPGSRP